jgi:hypothetical protein
MNTITNEQKREIKQLRSISQHYFVLSRKIKNRLPEAILSKSIKTITQDFSAAQSIVGDLRSAMLLTAHLGSCAVRLDTIEQILGKEISNQRLQKYDSLIGEKENLTLQRLKGTENHIIHFLLRNNIGHFEPHGVSGNMAFNTAEKFFQALTINQIFESMEKVIKSIKGDINQANS